jgi:nucleoside 2-deoxyribosyltransferase
VKFYVAGKTHDMELVREVQAMAREAGHEITWDWTQIVEITGPDVTEIDRKSNAEEQRGHAESDVQGVRDCDVLIVVLRDERIVGTLIETGVQLGKDGPIWVLGEWPRHSVFFHMHNFINVKGHDDLRSRLDQVRVAEEAQAA